MGSWARGSAGVDSDVDIVILTDAPSQYLEFDDWAAELDVAGFIGLRNWGALTERRAITSTNIEVEFGITTPAWASVDPVDDGTRRVVRDGIRILYDPAGLLDRLVRVCTLSP